MEGRGAKKIGRCKNRELYENREAGAGEEGFVNVCFCSKNFCAHNFLFLGA